MIIEKIGNDTNVVHAAKKIFDKRATKKETYCVNIKLL